MLPRCTATDKKKKLSTPTHTQARMPSPYLTLPLIYFNSPSPIPAFVSFESQMRFTDGAIVLDVTEEERSARQGQGGMSAWLRLRGPDVQLFHLEGRTRRRRTPGKKC